MSDFVVINTFKEIREAFAHDSLYYKCHGNPTAFKVKNLDDFVLDTNIEFFLLDEEVRQADKILIDGREYVVVLTKSEEGVLISLTSLNRWCDAFRMPKNKIYLSKLREICNHRNSPEDQVTVEKMK